MLCDAPQTHDAISPALMTLKKLSEGSQTADEEPRLRNVCECVHARGKERDQEDETER